ncbi:MAG TPA: tetratricopeptide repeat protein [Methanoregula sp.]|nr:tetratricopeptide repeat protein [Methanoregula sp.]
MQIHVIFLAMIVLVLLTGHGMAEDSPESFTAAGALYSQSVDLAGEGKYQEALDASDKALALNASSLTGLIQSNRAGILVMLDRNEEAITAADAALAVNGNLTGVHSVSWYNKGNALRALGRIAEAQDAYAHAYALDNTLVPPDMSADVPVRNGPVASTPKSPLPAGLVLVAFGVMCCAVMVFGKD